MAAHRELLGWEEEWKLTSGLSPPLLALAPMGWAFQGELSADESGGPAQEVISPLVGGVHN